MLIGRRSLMAGAAMAPLAARAQESAPLRIGVLTDENGPYSDAGGAGSIVAAQMAVQDFGPSVLGRPIEIVHADTQNKPDVAATIAGDWYKNKGVDLIIDLPVTAIAAAVQQVARTAGKSVIITAAATSDFTAKTCAPTSIHFADDTNAMTVGLTRAVLQEGGKTWFFITVDHAFGRALQEAATKVIEANGGRVVGAVRHPIGQTDYASLLLQAQSSGAQVVGLASVGGDLINVIKQAHEFGLTDKGGTQMATFLTYITDIQSLGLPVAQGLMFTSSFYWDQNDAARAFAKRFFAARNAMPTRQQAQDYAAVTHYLRAVAKSGSVDALAVNQAMRTMKLAYFGREASVRADGRVMFAPTLYRVKKPDQSHAAWDYYTAVRDIPAAEAFLPMSAACGAG